jgi:flagellum-specific peptidoglycan hydrolase FlgJ
MSLWAQLSSVLSAVWKTRRISITRRIKWTGYVRPDIADFFVKVKEPALKIEAEFGIPWIFAATQSGHESRWGQSKLTTLGNNLFGFTANDKWVAAGSPTIKFITRESSDKPPEAIRYWTFPGDIFKKDKTPAGGSELQVWRHFRKYASWEESLRDWAGLLSKPRYARALAGAKTGNFVEFAQGLQEGGYATDRDETTGQLVYAKKLIDLHKQIEGIA